MHIKRRYDLSSPGNRAGWAVRVFFFFFTQVLLWFCLELPRKGSAKGIEVRDARVKVHPVIWLTSEAQDSETQPHFVHSGGRDFCTAFRWQRFMSTPKESEDMKVLVLAGMFGEWDSNLLKRLLSRWVSPESLLRWYRSSLVPASTNNYF
jgi:hypothetical protein